MNSNTPQPQTRRCFIDDKNDEARDAYFELTSDDYDTDDLHNLIAKHPNFLDPYLQVANDLREIGDEQAARELEGRAFKRAIEQIVDEEGKWPDDLVWAIPENRHIIRALGIGADNLWKDGDTAQALELYRKLFHANLNDNIGARYAIIALRLGLTYDEYEQQVWPRATMPVEHISNWFKEHASKFPEELEAWREYCKNELGLDEKDLA